MPLTDNYPRRRLSAIVEGPGYPRAPAGDLRAWAGQVVEKVRVASVGGRLRFLPWLDPYSDETPEMRREYRRMLVESSVKAAFETKVFSVVSEDVLFQVNDDADPREQEGARFCQYAFDKLKGGTLGLGWSILHPAIIEGHSVCEKVWCPEPLRRGRFAGKRIYHAVKSKDTHFLQLGIDPYRNVTALRGTGFNAGRVWSPDDFVIFTYFSLFENPSGMSDFRAAYRPYWVKNTVWTLRALHLEQFTGPFMVGHYTNQESRAALEEAFDNAKSSTWLTVPVGDVVECLDLAMKGTSDFKDAISDCDREILIAIVGAHLQILEGQGGSIHGDTSVHQQTGELVQWWMAASLAEVYKEQLVVPLMAENYHDVEPPDVSIGAITDEAMLKRSQVYEGLQKIGLDISKRAAYRAFNMQPPDPKDRDDVLRPPGQGGQGPGGPAGPGGPPAMPPAEPDQGGGGSNGQALSEKEVRQGPASFGGGADRWPYDFSEAGWQAFAAASASRKVGEKWQGPSGKWFTKRPDGRVVPTSSPDQEKAVEAKRKQKEDAAAAKARARTDAAVKAKAAKEAAVKQKAALAAKKKAEAEAKRKAAEDAKVKAAAAKEAAAKKVQATRQQAAQHIRDVVSGSATTTPAKVKAAGVQLLSMTATELRALKSEIGAKGGGAAKAGLVQAITERALAARKAGKGKAPPVKPKPGKQVGPSLTAAAPDNPLLLAMVAAEPDFLTSGAAVGIGDIRKALSGVPKEQVDAALNQLIDSGVLAPIRNNFPDNPQQLASIGLTKADLVADGKGNYFQRFSLDGRTPEGKAFGAAADPKFTGTDALGRKWVNGKLVAKEEKPAGKGPTTPAEAAKRLAALPAMPGGGKSHALAPFIPIEEFPYDGKALDKALDRYEASEEMVDLSQLHIEQVGVERRGVEHYLDNPAKVSTSEEADPRYSDGLIVVRTGGKLYLADGNHRATAGVLRGMGKMKAYVVDLPAVNEVVLPKDQEAALAKQKFTGTDRLGRKWVNGKLVAKEEKPAGKGPDGHQEYTASDGSKVQAPFYDQNKVPADFAIPDKPSLLRDAVAASEELRRKNYGVLNTADLYDALKARHPDLDLHDFHHQLFAWQKQDLMVTQTTNDPEVLTASQVAKSPAVKDVRGVPVLRGQLRFSAKGLEEAKKPEAGPAKPETPPASSSTADALRELQDARASTHHLPHQSMPLAELRDRLGLTDPQALDLVRRLRQEQGLTAETRSGDLLGQNGVSDVVIPLGGVQPRHKAPATAAQIEAAMPKVEAAVREAAAALPPGGQVKISDLRRQLGLGRHEFDATMHALRRAGKVKLDAISNLRKATPGELADAMPGVNETLFYVEPAGAPPQQPAAPASTVHEGALLDAYKAIRDEPHNKQLGGIVKVPDLYDAMKKTHPDLTLDQFHHELMRLQSEDKLTMGAVNDPRLEPRAREMITPDKQPWNPALQAHGRGLLGYVRIGPHHEKNLRAGQPAPPQQPAAPTPPAPAAPREKPAAKPPAAGKAAPAARITPAHVADVAGAFEDMGLYQEVRRDGIMRVDQARDIFNRKTGLDLSPKEWAGFLEAAHKANVLRLLIENHVNDASREPEYAAAMPHFGDRAYGYLEPPQTPAKLARLEAFAKEYAEGKRQVEAGNTLADEVARGKKGK